MDAGILSDEIVDTFVDKKSTHRSNFAGGNNYIIIMLRLRRLNCLIRLCFEHRVKQDAYYATSRPMTDDSTDFLTTILS